MARAAKAKESWGSSRGAARAWTRTTLLDRDLKLVKASWSVGGVARHNWPQSVLRKVYGELVHDFVQKTTFLRSVVVGNILRRAHWTGGEHRLQRLLREGAPAARARSRALRLKQSQHALGLAGTTRCKGYFRGTARFALALLCANSRCLRTLFAAFIFDLISEWLSKQSADFLQCQML